MTKSIRIFGVLGLLVVMGSSMSAALLRAKYILLNESPDEVGITVTSSSGDTGYVLKPNQYVISNKLWHNITKIQMHEYLQQKDKYGNVVTRDENWKVPQGKVQRTTIRYKGDGVFNKQSGWGDFRQATKDVITRKMKKVPAEG